MSPEWIFALKVIGVVIVSYFIGNINFADIISHKRNVDIHKQGSGNPGTMNMLRTFGFRVAALTLILDILKGIIPTIAGYYIMQIGPQFGMSVSSDAPLLLGYYTAGVGKLGMALGAVSAVLGHAFPVINRFRGGKGVATALGAFFAFNPLIALGGFVCGIIYLLLHKYACVASFICVLSISAVEIALAVVYSDNVAVIVLVAAVAILVVALHHPNIRSLIKGTERNSNLILMARNKSQRKKAEKEAIAEAKNSVEPTQNEGAVETDSDEIEHTQDTNN